MIRKFSSNIQEKGRFSGMALNTLYKHPVVPQKDIHFFGDTL